MSLFGWFSDLFRGTSPSLGHIDSNPTSTGLDETAINPANGLPMIGGMGGIDVEGNPYGTDSDTFSDDHLTGINDSDPFDHGGGFDDW